MKDTYLKYFGNVRAILTEGSQIHLVSTHSENKPTAIFTIDAEKHELTQTALTTGATALSKSSAHYWVATSNHQLITTKDLTKIGKAIATDFENPIAAIAPIADGGIAALSDTELKCFDAKGKLAQTITLEHKGCALAADPTGSWISVGSVNGQVTIFSKEGKKTWQQTTSAKLHEGAVNAILFEPNELRFITSGADGKLLISQARGELDPTETQNRDRGNSHSKPVTSLMHVSENRFLTGSKDSSIKSWLRTGATRPATYDKVQSVIDLGVVDIYERPHLAVLCKSGDIQLLLLKDGKIEKKQATIHDLYDYLDKELNAVDIRRQETALAELGILGDSRAVQTLAEQASGNSDNQLRLKATDYLAKSNHPEAQAQLSILFGSNDPKVAITAFEGAMKLRQPDDLSLFETALSHSSSKQINILALKTLQALAKKDEQALSLCVETLASNRLEVRTAALLLLEDIYPEASPEASILALQTNFPDSHRNALFRLSQRNLLDNPRSLSAIRHCLDSDAAEVHQAAWLCSLQTRPALATALRSLDADLHRQLWDWENAHPLEIAGEESSKKTTQTKAKATAKPKKTKIHLSEEDRAPLFQAMASSVTTSSLNGALGLALLQDQQALGLLLQLSRDGDKNIRRTVCKALSHLNHAQATNRLKTLLSDKEIEVRDAAYKGLHLNQKSSPLLTAKAGLNASHDDVRMHGLKTLIQETKKSKPKAGDPTWELLQQALQTPSSPVRNETYKTILSNKVGGSIETALRLALTSSHADIRQEVLTETIAHVKQEWGWELILELFNDPSADVRTAAFDFTIRLTKGRDVAPMKQALDSTHTDLRLKAVSQLAKRKTHEAQAIIATAIEDADHEVRQAALAVLIDSSAQENLENALLSPFQDISLGAAKALALTASPKAKKALLTLLEQLQPEPHQKQELQTWQTSILGALTGLESIAEADSIEKIEPFIDSNIADIAHQAIAALASSASPEQADVLKKYIHHDDKAIAQKAYYGLALIGDPLGIHFKKSTLQSAYAMYQTAPDYLYQSISPNNPETSHLLSLILMLRTWKSATVDDILPLLSLCDASNRLKLAKAITVASNEKAYAALMLTYLGEKSRGHGKLELDLSTATSIAQTLTHGIGKIVHDTIALLKELYQNTEKINTWKLLWKSHSNRYAKELTALGKKKSPKKSIDSEELNAFVFGCYVGILREKQLWNGEEKSALAALLEMAKTEASLAPQIIPICLQALNHHKIEVRKTAFEAIIALGQDPDFIASQCLESEHLDIGVLALKLLTQEAGISGEAVLTEAMMLRRDELAIKAAELLVAKKSATVIVKVATKAIISNYAPLRSLAIQWLAKELTDGNKKAQKSLVNAAEKTIYNDTKIAAIQALAETIDPAALKLIIDLLDSASNEKDCAPAIKAFNALGDPIAAELLLDRVEREIHHTSDTFESLIGAAADFRRPEDVPRLLHMAEQERWRKKALRAIQTISGHDFSISIDLENPQLPEEIDRTWLDKQHPLRDEIFAQLLAKHFEFGMLNEIKSFRKRLHWVLTNSIDETYLSFLSTQDDELRTKMIAIISWRSRYRHSDVSVLTDLTDHKDPITQFYAAEALALNGKSDGLSILMAAVELMDGLEYRERAVKALGVLADEKSLDLLLRLASNAEHALNSAAATALGHLNQSKEKEKIFKLLEQMSKSSSPDKSEASILGLRHFNSPDGWMIIRELVKSEAHWTKKCATEALSYDTSAERAESGEILLRELRDSSYVAHESAIRFFGKDSLEPDYAVVHTYWNNITSIERIVEHGEPARMLEILPQLIDDELSSISNALLSRDPLPVKEAEASLDSLHPEIVSTSAKIIAQAAKKSKALTTALDYWLDLYSKQDDEDEDIIEDTVKVITSLIWALGKTGDLATLMTLTDSYAAQPKYETIRIAATHEICATKPTAKTINWLLDQVNDSVTAIRDIAIQTLTTYAPKKAEAVSRDVLHDASQYRLIAKANATPKPEEWISNKHYSAVVMPQVLENADIKNLLKQALDSDNNETTRQSLIEALAALADEKAEQALAKIGSNDKVETDLRKAAWRARRRSIYRRTRT